MLLYMTLALLLVPAYSNDICCSPDQYECQEGLLTGSVDDEGHSAATYGTIAFSYDATNQRVYEDLRLTVTNMSRNYKILQFYKQNLEYIIEGSVCTQAKPETSWRPSCIPSNATALPSYTLGPKNHSLSVKDYVFQMGTNTVTIGVTGNCIPVIYKSYGEINGQSVMTFTGFQDLTVGLKDPHIFDVPDICKHAQPATNNKQDTLAGECFPVSNRTNTFDIVQLDTVSLFNLSFQRRHCLKVHAKRSAERLTIQVVAEAGRYNVALQKVQQLGSGREKHLKTSV